MKKKYLWLFAASMFSFSSCNDIDNYDAPNGSIKGAIYDAQTNQPIPLPVQGSSGTRINLYELNTDATKPVDFYAKQDGTYENSQIFNCEYKVEIMGPFVDECIGTVTVKGQTQLDLKATPFARIEATASAVGNKVTIQYNVAKTDPSFIVNEISGIWNVAPGVDVNNSNLATRVTAQGEQGSVTFDLDKDKNFIANKYKIQANGNKIYLRIAAKVTKQNTNEESKTGVNYSSVIIITL